MTATANGISQRDPRDYDLTNEETIVKEHGVEFGVDARIGARVRDGNGEGVIVGLTDQLVIYRDDKTGRECAERYGFCEATLRPPATLPGVSPTGPCSIYMYSGRPIRVAVDAKMTDARLGWATPAGVFAEVMEGEQQGETVGVAWRDVDLLVTADDFDRSRPQAGEGEGLDALAGPWGGVYSGPVPVSVGDEVMYHNVEQGTYATLEVLGTYPTHCVLAGENDGDDPVEVGWTDIMIPAVTAARRTAKVVR